MTPGIGSSPTLLQGIRAELPLSKGNKMNNRFSANNGNYRTKGHAIRAFSASLAHFGCHFDCNDIAKIIGNDGLQYCAIIGKRVGLVCLEWCRNWDGSYDFTGFVDWEASDVPTA